MGLRGPSPELSARVMKAFTPNPVVADSVLKSNTLEDRIARGDIVSGPHPIVSMITGPASRGLSILRGAGTRGTQGAGKAVQQPNLPLTGSTGKASKGKKPKPGPKRKPGKRQQAATTAKDLGIEVKSRDTAATINQKIEAHRTAQSAKQTRKELQTQTASAGAKQRERVLSGADKPVRSAAGTVSERTKSTSGRSEFVSPQQRAIEAAEAVRGGRAGTTATGQKALPAPRVETPKTPVTPTGPKGPKDQPRTPDVIQLSTKKPADTSGPYTPGAGPKGGMANVEATAGRANRQKAARAKHEKRMEQAKSSGFNQFSSRHPDAPRPAAPHLQGRGVKPTFTQQAGITLRSGMKKLPQVGKHVSENKGFYIGAGAVAGLGAAITNAPSSPATPTTQKQPKPTIQKTTQKKTTKKPTRSAPPMLQRSPMDTITPSYSQPLPLDYTGSTPRSKAKTPEGRTPFGRGAYQSPAPRSKPKQPSPSGIGHFVMPEGNPVGSSAAVRGLPDSTFIMGDTPNLNDVVDRKKKKTQQQYRDVGDVLGAAGKGVGNLIGTGFHTLGGLFKRLDR
tara:strand:- start:227 stop:1918 length:1692 start_codon:yes stop_codon:yes gene_type:complete